MPYNDNSSSMTATIAIIQPHMNKVDLVTVLRIKWRQLHVGYVAPGARKHDEYTTLGSKPLPSRHPAISSLRSLSLKRRRSQYHTSVVSAGRDKRQSPYQQTPVYVLLPSLQDSACDRSTPFIPRTHRRCSSEIQEQSNHDFFLST